MNWREIMTNSSRIVLISIALFLLGASVPETVLAKGKPIKIETANPNQAEQGQDDFVTLTGGNFPVLPYRAKVTFIYNASGESGGVVVPNGGLTSTISADSLVVEINVEDSALLGEYDIKVEEVLVDGALSGRKGKGTTLFTVKEKAGGNQNIVNCDIFAPRGTCTCKFDLDEDLLIYKMQEDCFTSETLYMGEARIGGNSVTGSVMLTARNCAVTEADADHPVNDCHDFEGNFKGSSVVSNIRDGSVAGNSAGVWDLDIRFETGVKRGCGEVINSAISFVLDESTRPRDDMNSFLQIGKVSVVSDWPLCTAIEIIREPGYLTTLKDWKVRVEESSISNGSYVESGIRLLGMQPQQDINPPLVWGNTIEGPACDSNIHPEANPDGASAIEFGRVLLSDPQNPSSQIAGVVESNTIRMMTSCNTPGGVGIDILGEPNQQSGTPGTQTTVDVVKNNVSGAYIGVLVDENVVEAKFSGNTLTGDGIDETGDIGICSDAQSTSYKGKPNRIRDFDDDTIENDCL
jgi:hypothetical protein